MAVGESNRAIVLRRRAQKLHHTAATTHTRSFHMFHNAAKTIYASACPLYRVCALSSPVSVDPAVTLRELARAVVDESEDACSRRPWPAVACGCAHLAEVSQRLANNKEAAQRQEGSQ